MPATTTGRLWLQALSQRSVWRRATIVGLTAGVLQVSLHQGDVLLKEGPSLHLLAKCLLSPAIGIAVALASAAWVYVEREQSKQNTQANQATQATLLETT